MRKTLTAKQKKHKQALFRRRVLLLLLLAIAIISICLFTPWFHVKTVEVVGNNLIPSERIIQMAAIPQDVNIFKVNKRAIKKSVLQIPEIESIDLHRQLPSKICLEVVETSPVMYMPYLTGFAITNKKGRVLTLSDNPPQDNLLYITGLEIKNAEICKKISVQDMVMFDIIEEMVQVFIDKGILSEFRSCHFDNLSDFYAYLVDGTKIIFGKTTDLDYKISVLSAILPKVNRIDGSYIDLTTPSRAVYGTLPAEPPVEEEPADEVKMEDGENNASDAAKKSVPDDAPSATDTSEVTETPAKTADDTQ